MSLKLHFFHVTTVHIRLLISRFWTREYHTHLSEKRTQSKSLSFSCFATNICCCFIRDGLSSAYTCTYREVGWWNSVSVGAMTSAQLLQQRHYFLEIVQVSNNLWQCLTFDMVYARLDWQTEEQTDRHT